MCNIELDDSLAENRVLLAMLLSLLSSSRRYWHYGEIHVACVWPPPGGFGISLLPYPNFTFLFSSPPRPSVLSGLAHSPPFPSNPTLSLLAGSLPVSPRLSIVFPAQSFPLASLFSSPLYCDPSYLLFLSFVRSFLPSFSLYAFTLFPLPFSLSLLSLSPSPNLTSYQPTPFFPPRLIMVVSPTDGGHFVPEYFQSHPSVRWIAWIFIGSI